MRDKKLILDTPIEAKVETDVARNLKAMAEHSKIPLDEMVNTALKRYIATHSDYLPPRKKGA